jgi:hypothetical protein
MLEKILQSANYIKERIKGTPKIGIILGTGLGGLVEKIDTEIVIPYKDIPNFPVSTVKGHGGNLIVGKLNGTQVVAMQGRFHFYEGYSAQDITFPVRVLKYLGIERLFVSKFVRNSLSGCMPKGNPEVFNNLYFFVILLNKTAFSQPAILNSILFVLEFSTP